MVERKLPTIRGNGPVRPTFATAFLQARDSVSVVDAIALVMRRVRHEVGQSQREYALTRGWSKSFQARLEVCAQKLVFREVLNALTGTGFGLAVVKVGGQASDPIDDWTAAELIARDGAGRRFPAARKVERATRAPNWWMWKHGSDITVRTPEWTSSVVVVTTVSVRPKLVVDSADRAIEFYREVLGAALASRHTMGQAVVFAQLNLPGGDVLQVKDADDVDRAPVEGGAGVILDVLCADPDAVVATAVEHGAEVVFPVADQPHGARQGRIRDPFGHQWIVGTATTKSDAQVQAALDSWASEESQ